jgi:hypothetical protein
MSAFDILKNHIAEQAQAQEVEEPVVDEAQTTLPLNEPAEPVVNEAKPLYQDSNYPQLLKEFKEQAAINGSPIFMGIGGHSGRGKTGIAMDAFMHYRKDNEMMWCYDFDFGANDCKQAHYPGADDIIRIWNPWVTQPNDRTAFDYPKTHQRVMDLCRFAIEYAKKQKEPGFNGQILKALLITAVDQFDNVCINNMKIYDLEMDAKDAIEAAASKLNKEIGWNWSIRKTRFKQLTALCRQLNFLGVDVFWETHIKSGDDEYSHDGWKFVWEKDANNDLTQILWCKDEVVRDEDGKPTGETRYKVEFTKCKTNADLQGQERTFFITKKGQPAEWLGLAELRSRSV